MAMPGISTHPKPYYHPNTCPYTAATIWAAIIAISAFSIGMAAQFNQHPFHGLNAIPLFVVGGAFTIVTVIFSKYLHDIIRNPDLPDVKAPA